MPAVPPIASHLPTQSASAIRSLSAYFCCWPSWDATGLLESLAVVVDFSVKEPEVVTLWANFRFAVDQLPVRVAALLAAFITAELSRFIKILSFS
jgi:hypothetical protein